MTKKCSPAKAYASIGLSTGKSKSNVKWKIVKDLSGYPSHEEGGVDIRIDNSGAYFKHSSGKEIKAAEGLYIQGTGWDEIKAAINPMNWGSKDFSDKPDFNSAFTSARKEGLTSFMYNNKRYNTNYAGTKDQQLKEAGILNEQKVNRSEIQNRLAKNIMPFSYENQAKRVWDAVVKNEEDIQRTEMNESLANKGPMFEEYKRRADAYNTYMGIPQQYNTFGVSKTKPSKSTNPNATYYKINNPSFYKILATNYDDAGVNSDIQNLVMGNFTIDYGKDERGNYVSYYDKWDIAPIDYGKPFEIYDRVYYREREVGKDINNRPVKKRFLMNYSDSELMEFNPEKPSADTYLLQEELANLGYELPKSTLKRGKRLENGYFTTFDGIYGSETKQALIDWQTKNKK